MWVIPARRDGRWVLAYVTDRKLYDHRPYYELILGDPPCPDPRVSERAEKLGWLTPESIRTLYRIHDGLGSPANGILASRDLTDLGEIMDPIAAKENYKPKGYVFPDLLEFFPDGSGNCQSFMRRRRTDSDPPTVDWDHETREVSDEVDFFTFADDALLRLVMDEE